VNLRIALTQSDLNGCQGFAVTGTLAHAC
jgi:hypothetical protein